MGHARILQHLALYLTFPNLDTESYSLQNTGDRSIEAIQSIFRGGTANLPITSANLTFQEFLCRMNQVTQIKDAEFENALYKIPGNFLTSSKKWKLTFAPLSSNEPVESSSSLLYEKPDCYSKFLAELTSACKKGNEDSKESKQLMEKLVPNVVKSLKKKNGTCFKIFEKIIPLI